MRTAFYVLIFANLLFLAWARWIDVPAAPRAQSSAPNLPRLKLADEAPRERRVDNDASGSLSIETASASASVRPQPASRCVSVGPFNDLTRAARAAALLRERGFSPQQRAVEGEMWEGYWVFVGSVKDEAEEKRMLTALDRAGIKDAHPMPESTGGDRRVSLGLFSERDRAERRARAATRLGYKPEITERTQAGTVYWVDLDLGTVASTVPTEGLLSLEEAGSRIEIRVCPGSRPEPSPGLDLDPTATADAGMARPS